MSQVSMRVFFDFVEDRWVVVKTTELQSERFSLPLTSGADSYAVEAMFRVLIEQEREIGVTDERDFSLDFPEYIDFTFERVVSWEGTPADTVPIAASFSGTPVDRVSYKLNRLQKHLPCRDALDSYQRGLRDGLEIARAVIEGRLPELWRKDEGEKMYEIPRP